MDLHHRPEDYETSELLLLQPAQAFYYAASRKSK